MDIGDAFVFGDRELVKGVGFWGVERGFWGVLGMFLLGLNKIYLIRDLIFVVCEHPHQRRGQGLKLSRDR